MKIAETNYTITTIYFDGQFWCALIEQNRDGQNYTGRYVFGAEPTNPRLLHWIIHEFADVPLLPVDEKPKIRFKKLAKSTSEKGGIPKSLVAFSKAQKEYAQERKAQNRKQKKIEEKEKYLAKKEKLKKQK
ncbi:MAG: DUF2992 family protein [Treponema sp.]|nr:DUF2992 family protein [Candidatus Treponema equi]